MGEVQVRKDLALVSSGGRPKIGYNRAALIADIEQFLGYGNTNDAVLIGAGKLGRALLGYSGFAEYGLNIVAAFDENDAIIGTSKSGKPIMHLSRLGEVCRRDQIKALHPQLRIVARGSSLKVLSSEPSFTAITSILASV